jgi:hypothetical protein
MLWYIIREKYLNNGYFIILVLLEHIHAANYIMDVVHSYLCSWSHTIIDHAMVHYGLELELFHLHPTFYTRLDTSI